MGEVKRPQRRDKASVDPFRAPEQIGPIRTVVKGQWLHLYLPASSSQFSVGCLARLARWLRECLGAAV